ncbi:MAG: D-amino acid dehydrogenase [Pseudomonadota bacterium]|nr:D-amino acid dehydrogenase [Pseudomonadota bacterium]
MSVVVLGAGVIGVATAWYLSCKGLDVTVIERHQGPAEGTSHANGGQISVSHPEPWAAPGLPLQLLRWIGDRRAPLRVHPRADPAMWRWAYRFLRNCNETTRRRNTARIARLGQFSLAALAALRTEADIEFAWGTRGSLHVFTEPRALDEAGTLAELRRGLGIRQELVDLPGCLRVEPTLAASSVKIHGGIHAPDDACGDAASFTRELARCCARRGVVFHFDTSATGLEPGGREVRSVVTTRGRFAADAVVLAFGTGSPALVRAAGLRLPVYPVKGYSLDVPLQAGDPAPRVNLIHESRRLVTSHLGATLRIAGGADFGGLDPALPSVRARSVLSPAFELFPSLTGTQGSQYWAGLRPMTPDGVPIIGQTRIGNLFLNTGHGSLGWTLSCGSGRLVANIVAGDDPEIDPGDYVLDRSDR